MKTKLLFILIALATVCPVFGQSRQPDQGSQTKKVAIVETVDREGKVPKSIKSLVKSRLAQILSETSGYMVYDRGGIGQILGEHDFQRSGLVDDSQIQHLGEMEGVDYILNTEVSLLGDGSVMINASIVDIETARVENIAIVQTSMDGEAVTEAVRRLSDSLLDIHRGRVIEL